MEYWRRVEVATGGFFFEMLFTSTQNSKYAEQIIVFWGMYSPIWGEFSVK